VKSVLMGLESCPFCYEGKRGRAVHAGHFGYRGRSRKVLGPCMAILRRREAASSIEGSSIPTSSAGLLSVYPAVAEFLSLTQWEDGSSRTTGTVMIFVEDACWKIWANDRDAGQGCFLSGSTLTLAMEQLEVALSSGSGDWRAPRGKRSR
jgi:hypothetical protein